MSHVRSAPGFMCGIVVCGMGTNSFRCFHLLQKSATMSDMESMATLMESTGSKLQQLQRAFAELESQSAVSLNLKWKQLEDHFHGLEQSLKKKFDDLKRQEEEFEETVAKSEQMLEQQEAVVVAKELTSLEKLQQKRDAALAVIFGKSKLNLSTPLINPISKSVNNNAVLNGNIGGSLSVKWPKPATAHGAYLQDENTAVKPRSQLVVLCEEMNVNGLHKFISDNRKDLTSIREEIPVALRGATDPYGLVLASLEDFYFGDNLILDGKKDGNLLGVRRTCLMLMESLAQLQTDATTGFISEGQVLTASIKERAKKIALEWKSKLESLDFDASNGNCLEAHAFLQLLATFGIFAEFAQDELCKLLPSVSRRRQTPELCRILGLSQNMPGQCYHRLIMQLVPLSINNKWNFLFLFVTQMFREHILTTSIIVHISIYLYHGIYFLVSGCSKRCLQVIRIVALLFR